MKTYLKWINPIVAILIFLWCCYIYFGGMFIEITHHEFTFEKFKDLIDPRDNNFNMYFIIKGLFCSIMLLIVGDYFKRIYDKDNKL